MVSTLPTNMRLQQYRRTPSESITFAGSSPALTRAVYCEYLSAISPPHVKHLTGTNTRNLLPPCNKNHRQSGDRHGMAAFLAINYIIRETCKRRAKEKGRR